MRNLIQISLYTLLFCLSLLLSGCSQRSESLWLTQLPHDTQQVLLVSNHSWSDNQAILQRFEKQQGIWKQVAAPIPVQVGRNGMAWGRGLHNIKNLSQFKQEGDGKAPAGIFKLASSFGYASVALSQQTYPYRTATLNDYYIDDSESKDYNRWVHIAPPLENTPKVYWKSYEKMRRDDARYELGIEVEHNKNPILAGAGSAIFMHVWKDKNTSTAGCTAMSKANMMVILRWLKQDKQPVLVQVPSQALDDLQLSVN